MSNILDFTFLVIFLNLQQSTLFVFHLTRDIRACTNIQRIKKYFVNVKKVKLEEFMVGTIGHGLKLSIYKKVQVNSISFGIQNPVRFQIVSIQNIWDIVKHAHTSCTIFSLKWQEVLVQARKWIPRCWDELHRDCSKTIKTLKPALPTILKNPLQSWKKHWISLK